MNLYRIIYKTATTRKTVIIPAPDRQTARHYLVRAMDHADIISVARSDRYNFINNLISSKPALFSAEAIADGLQIHAEHDIYMVSAASMPDVSEALQADQITAVYFSPDSDIIICMQSGAYTPIKSTGLSIWDLPVIDRYILNAPDPVRIESPDPKLIEFLSL